MFGEIADMKFDLVERVKIMKHVPETQGEDKDAEFFHMTYLANILQHPKKNKLKEIFGNSHYKELYNQAKQ